MHNRSTQAQLPRLRPQIFELILPVSFHASRVSTAITATGEVMGSLKSNFGLAGGFPAAKEGGEMRMRQKEAVVG